MEASIAVLLLGAFRPEYLDGEVLSAFLGGSTQRRVFLDPHWVRGQYTEYRSRPLGDFACALVDDMLAQSHRVALRKMRVENNGQMILPTKLHEREGRWFAESAEGAGNIGVRVDQVGQICTQLGVIFRDERRNRGDPSGPRSSGAARMTHVRFDFQSPLALIRQWQQRVDGARLLEVLITGYTLDLAFFEKRLVSMARGLGARITVLADAHQAVHDPADVRLAGMSYQHANVSCRGAFHPKLAVLVGEEDVWIAIGSGNPTTSGWGHNDELWLVLRSSRRSGPAALTELSQWLSALHRHVAMPSWIASTVAEVAAIITPDVTDDSVPALRILGNLERRFIDQLPLGRVDSLALAAPFFDPASSAVREFVARFKPDQLIVGFQPTLSSYAGSSLVDAAGQAAHAEFRDLPEADRRMSHGKLVEWALEGQYMAMVGSPNLSYAALLASTDQGGNCELAAVFGVDQSLMPEGTNVALDVLRTRSTMPADSQSRQKPPVTLLGARRQDDGITVELLAGTDAAILIETSPNGGPGTWQQCHVIRPSTNAVLGAIVSRFQAPEQMGAAVRAVVDDPKQPYITPAVFLTDTTRCLPRQVDSSAPRLRQQFGDVFSDEKLQRRFETDLLRLLAENAAHRTPRRLIVPRAAAANSGVEY